MAQTARAVLEHAAVRVLGSRIAESAELIRTLHAAVIENAIGLDGLPGATRRHDQNPLQESILHLERGLRAERELLPLFLALGGESSADVMARKAEMSMTTYDADQNSVRSSASAV